MMKVIINFGEVKCIVPVGDGNIKVKHVITLAIDRYRKATSKPPNSWVVVHNLKTCRDGAILDPDDRLSDVADDREQIIASFEEHDSSPHNLNSITRNGIHSDRTGSSATTDSFGFESPDVFINDNKMIVYNNSSEIDVKDINKNNISNIKIVYNDEEYAPVTIDHFNSGVSVPLQVRRGSEPVLNKMSPDIDVCNELDPTKRWSTAVAIDSKNNRNTSTHSLDASFEHSDDDKEKSLENSNSLSPRSIKEEGYGSEEKSEETPSSTTSNNTFSRFSRGSGRLSMIANNLDVWAEAADRQLLKINKDNSPVKDTNELNKNTISVSKHSNYELGESSLSSMSSEDNTKHKSIEHSVIVNLAKESGPLGIHVVPDNDDIGCGNGLLIQGIEPGGRIDRDGRLHVGDSIIEINGQSICSVDFERAQEIFRNALQSEDITLRLIKYDNQSHNTSVKKPFPPPVLPKPANIMKQHEQLRLEAGMVEGEERAVQHTKVATVTPTKKLTASASHKPTPSSALVVANTRKIGKKYHIQLKKESDGLGFSITTRDNPAGGNCPIYIKNILKNGAAVRDGRLRAGDRLLEVCGIEMTGKPQSEAVKILRTIPLGTTVDLIVSRQELDVSPSPQMPRQLPPEKSGETTSSSWNEEREVLTFEIPLNDTGSAGLGVSVKGKTSRSSGQDADLGIFVKAVINGGAASKDGRLKTNDQLININGIPLLSMTNSQAMETLRRAMIQSEGPIANPNAITLTVARRVPHQFSSSCHQRNDSLLSATSNDSCNEENLSPTNDMFINKFDDTCDSYRSNENTVIYRPRSDSLNRDPKNLSSNPQNPVINQSSSNTTFLKQYYLSENHDTNTIYEKSNQSRNDVIIEQDIVDGDSNDKSVVNNPNVNPESTPRDKVSSSEENADGFRRDGFGRQSMSEKRHAQLDAKNTDTYRRNKKAKEEKEKQQKDKWDSKNESMSEMQSTQNSQAQMLPHQPVPNNIVVIQRSVSDESLTATGLTCLSQSHITVTNKRKCQSPGSCPYHSTHTNDQKKEIGPSLGMRKSSSLESLQTMMQDLQKEQLEAVGAFTGPRHATVRVSRSRETNESFRAAVDRSYDAPNSIENHETMETVAEEGSESGSSVGHQTHANTLRPSGALSMASTQYTGTTATSSQITADDETTNFFKKKNSGKKKGLFKTLFKFGSKKGRSSPSKNVNTSDREPVGEQNSDQMSAQNAAQMYILEQERIQMHYKRLIEQQQKQQQSNQVSQSAQPTPPARQKSKSSTANKTQGPLHSTPTGVTSGQMQALSNEAIMSRNERMQQLRAQHQRMHAERQRLYPNDGEICESAYHSMDRKQLDYKNSERYVSPNYSRIYSYPLTPNFQARRLVLPQIEPIYNDNIVRKYPNAFQRRTSSLRCPNDLKNSGTDVMHTRGNSYDIYRQAMERPGSRVGIADHNSKYSHYMNYREIQQQMHQYHQQQQQAVQQHQQQAAQQQQHQYRQVYGSPVNVVPQEPVRQVIRSQHQRQVSSPVSHRQERPISNYYEYESVSAMKNATLLNQQQQQQLQKQHSIQQQNNTNNNNQSHSEHSSASLTRKHKYKNGENIKTGASIPVPIRQQQPIYQTNQLKIYGSTYSNGYSSQPNQTVPIYDSFQGNSNTNNNTNGYQIVPKYQSLRPGSKV